jgi:hypothetical protein
MWPSSSLTRRSYENDNDEDDEKGGMPQEIRASLLWLF